MRFSPVIKTDRLGREIILRSAEPEDAEALIRYLKTTAEETRFLLREPDEINITLEQEIRFIESNRNGERDLLLLAFCEGRHIGNCSLISLGSKTRIHHRCEVAIALYQAYCGCGIGRMMLETVLAEAKRLGFEQAELTVAAENSRAIALYESLGFVKYGRLPKQVKYRDGTYSDSFWMMKSLKNA